MKWRARKNDSERQADAPTIWPLPLAATIMTTIRDHLQTVRQRVASACEVAGRSHDAVHVLAVSKTQPAEAVRQAWSEGQRDFGENYVAEAQAKMAELIDLRPALTWHLIGPLQANKTRVVAELFDWVHSVDRLRIATRLSEQRPPNLAPLEVCLQVNISGEDSKSGCTPEELPALARAVAGLPRLRLRGLMVIPATAEGLEAQQAPLRATRQLFDALLAAGLQLDTLSMGMSGDLEAAVLEGATMVRIGTAIFGARPPMQEAP
jgi:pyridoxal phosphate enzyme (YggS family)